ncbi:MAG: hypothetical protein GY801_11605 [bacterium]|nr:hypothetical protein [bacterium]
MSMNTARGHLVWFLSVMLCGMSLLGCGSTNMALVRSQHVPIPAYETSDYEPLLSSDDPEIRYNAIANLIPHASTYARILEDGDANDSTTHMARDEAYTYARAQDVFVTIRSGLQGDDEDIKVASLMFLAEFAPIYSDQKALFTLVSQVKTNDVRTQYEQLHTLQSLIEPDTGVDRAMIGDFLGSRSWRIRNMTYLLLGHIVCRDMHPRLLHDYQKLTRDYDKLVLLQAFRQEYGAEVFAVLKEELVTSENSQIHTMIADILPGHHDETVVGQWIATTHEEMNDDVLLRIIDRYAEELSNSKGPAFFQGLFAATSSHLMQLTSHSLLVEHVYAQIQQAPDRPALIMLRESIQSHDSLKTRWNTHATERAQAEEALRAEEALQQRILPHYTDLLETFLEDTQRLLADFGMSAEEIDTATEDMRELLQMFEEEAAE